MIDYMNADVYKYNMKQQPCSYCLKHPKTVMLQTKKGELFHPKCLSIWQPRLVIVLPKGPLSLYNQKIAFQLAVKLENLALVKDVLRYGPIPERMKKKFINQATKKNHHQLVELLSKQTPVSNTKPKHTSIQEKITSISQILSHQPTCTSLLSNQTLNTSMISEKDQQQDKSDTWSISRYLNV